MTAEETSSYGKLPESLLGDKIYTFETNSITEDYFLLTKLGTGTYGYVIKAIHKETEEMYALKFLNIKFVRENTDLASLSRVMLSEVCIPRTLKHPNIIKYGKVKVYEITDDEQKIISYKFDLSEIATHALCIAMSVMDGDIKDLKIKNETYRKHVIFQCIEMLNYLKSQNVMHYDIKPDNILYTHQRGRKVPYKVVLGDFGLARTNICNIKDVDPNERYTLPYRPPELIELHYVPDSSNSEGEVLKFSVHDRIEAHSFAAEVWAMGCTLYEMITKEFLFNYVLPNEEIYSFGNLPSGFPGEEQLTYIDSHELNRLRLNFIRDQQIAFNGISSNKIDKGLKEVLDLMLIKDPKERATPSQLLKHSYFDSIRPAMEGWYRHQAVKLYKSPEDCLGKVLGATDRFIPTKGNPVTDNFRDVLLRWGSEVGEEFRFNTATRVAYHNYMERFLVANEDKLSQSYSQLQCILCAFMYIAATMNELWSNPISDYSYITASTYTSAQIFQCTLNLLHVLDWKIDIMTVYDLINAQPTKLLRSKDIRNDIRAILEDHEKSRGVYKAFHSLPEAEKYVENFFKEPSMLSR